MIWDSKGISVEFLLSGCRIESSDESRFLPNKRHKMSTAGRLNDNEVAQEMNKMVAFIKQEALEKARETKIKV